MVCSIKSALGCFVPYAAAFTDKFLTIYEARVLNVTVQGDEFNGQYRFKIKCFAVSRTVYWYPCSLAYDGMRDLFNESSDQTTDGGNPWHQRPRALCLLLQLTPSQSISTPLGNQTL
ncbi:hypothetical protein RHMOL_Rhmol07G0062600 [Rhododendron molle]|uniref:Uncharacterized protein n=1 Tax=Rhododendron molle TaxID=49168 RepID=A0ACC0MYV0_RHOML|nr:hypothetical protein RHMOL_Rhmol07G0062600 [Rhododendron molle]